MGEVSLKGAHRERRYDEAPYPRSPQGALLKWSAAVRGWPGALVLLAAAAVIVSMVELHKFDATSTLTGWLMTTAVAVAGIGLVVGVARRGLRWWATWGVGIAVVAAGMVLVARWWIGWSGLVTEHYPPSFAVWIWIALWTVGVALTGWWSGGAAVRVARVLTVPVALLASFLVIDAHYGYWPTVGVLLDRPAQGQVSGGALIKELKHRVHVAPGQEIGQYGPVKISGKSVGFAAARAWLWLPPAFFSRPHTHIPVILMLPGWPGDVQDWVKAGQVINVVNTWARDHHGIAPVMVFVDENGTVSDDTECVNGPQGNAERYLSSTVPRYIHKTLGITLSPRRFTVLGFSEGGTCAIGLGAEHPEVFGRLVDLAGDVAPNYGNGRSAVATLDDLYGDNVAAETHHVTLWVLTHHRYSHTQAWFGAGSDDTKHSQIAALLSAAATKAGMEVHSASVPGGHSWTFAREAFVKVYPALVRAMEDGRQAASPARPHHSRSQRHRFSVAAPGHDRPSLPR
jgi:enterochelin esterase-like enzyme